MYLNDLNILIERYNKKQMQEMKAEDGRTALLASVIYNSGLDICSSTQGKKVGKRMKPKDFMPKHDDKPKAQTWQEMKSRIGSFIGRK